MEITDDDPTKVQRYRALDLARVTSTPRPTLLRSLIPAMLADRVIQRRGRYWYGRRVDIEAWLLGRWANPVAADKSLKAR